MNAASSLPQPEFSGTEKNFGNPEIETPFRSIFEHAPVPVARCDRNGVIVEMNPAFERSLNHVAASKRCLRFCELVVPQEREKTESLLFDVFNARRESIGIVARSAGNGHSNTRWTAWRQPGCAGDSDHALLIAEPAQPEFSSEPEVPDSHLAHSKLTDSKLDDGVLQNQRWEAIGRLAGGVVHDFNNLLTGVMLTAIFCFQVWIPATTGGATRMKFGRQLCNPRGWFGNCWFLPGRESLRPVCFP